MWQTEARPPEEPCCALLEAVAIRIRVARYFVLCTQSRKLQHGCLQPSSPVIRVSPIRYATRVEYAEFGAWTAYRKNYVVISWWPIYMTDLMNRPHDHGGFETGQDDDVDGLDQI